MAYLQRNPYRAKTPEVAGSQPRLFLLPSPLLSVLTGSLALMLLFWLERHQHIDSLLPFVCFGFISLNQLLLIDSLFALADQTSASTSNEGVKSEKIKLEISGLVASIRVLCLYRLS